MLDPALQTYVDECIRMFDQITDERMGHLKTLAQYAENLVNAGESAKLIFICTHNSRRSHMAQIWAQTAAAYYEIPRIETFSGGTEATEFNSRAVAAMEHAGFEIEKTGGDRNPIYQVKYHGKAIPMEAFSKVFHEAPNPEKDFCAVMTCSEAEKNCPFIPGASLRVSLPYRDPKDYDGTTHEIAAYDERCRQIGCEMLCLFSLVELDSTGA